MNKELTENQINELAAEAKRASEQAVDVIGAYAFTYAMILSFIDPEATELLADLKSNDPLIGAGAATEMFALLHRSDANVRDIAIWLVGAYMVNSGIGGNPP
ncbi:hypothetical protein [Pseudomonas sp. UMAB-08]|uniref:hypothetical protein n=1 Tax=Pseudomonas sp. UMAB-08 TaxID=1365375 RepID=UPI001C573223|nr:hypothetical protein [Pseudomonas sp. UMAB-08]